MPLERRLVPGGVKRLNPIDPINAGLVGYWSMDGGMISGTTLADLSGNGNNGTLVGSSTLVNGITGQALSMGGGPGVGVSIANSTALNFPGGAATFSLWINPTSVAGYISLIGKRQSFVADTYEVYIDPSGLLGFFNGSINNTAVVPATNAWTHVAVTVLGSTTIIYVNGAATPPLTAALGGVTTTPVYLGYVDTGSGGPQQQFTGRMDDVRIYSRALLAAEVSRIYSDTSGNLGLIVPTRRLIVPPAAAPVVHSSFQIFRGFP